MKKFRGKRRYFKKLWSKVNTYEINVEDDSWFDFWHIHLDFLGLGNSSVKVRKEHIKVHIELYKKLLKQLEAFNRPYQTWICLHVEDSGSDAVYVHTKNPNSDDFPFLALNVDWNCCIPDDFKELIDLKQFHVGYFESDIEQIYYLQSKVGGLRI